MDGRREQPDNISVVAWIVWVPKSTLRYFIQLFDHFDLRVNQIQYCRHITKKSIQMGLDDQKFIRRSPVTRD